MNPSQKSPGKWIAAIAVFLIFFPGNRPRALTRETTTVPSEHIWAVVKIAGQPAGYYHEKTETNQNGDISTWIEMVIIINRMNSKVEIRSNTQYEENQEGRLMAVKSESSSSRQSTLMEVAVGEGSLQVRTTSGDKSYDRKVRYSGVLSGQEGMRRISAERLKSPGDKISIQTFMPELGSVAAVIRRMISTEQLTIEGRQWPAIKVDDVVENLPGKTISWLDSEGRILKQVQDSPFGEIETVRTMQKPAQMEDAAAGRLPAEAYEGTLARSNILLPHERSIECMKIRITHKKPDLGWPNLEADNQRILEKTCESLVLEIRRSLPRMKAKRPVKSTPELEPFLNANPLLQSDDAGVQSILSGIKSLDGEVFRASLALQKWTEEHMQFDSGIAVVSASEVARDRKGTCFGYSVLLSSLARAAGIPSRIRMGYLYVSGIWGGHAWVDVLVGDQWVPIDAAAYSMGAADAARFSAFTSSLQEGISTQIGALMQLYGNLDIKVLEYTVKGRRIEVPADAKPYEVDKNIYRNPWLGLTVVKPNSFQFTKLDAVWPDDTVVEMEGPSHQIIEVQKSQYLPQFETRPAEYLRRAAISGVQYKIKISGSVGFEISSSEKAGLVILDEDQVWILKATGAEAPFWLSEVASRMRFAH
jgi:hypothetical protein